MPRRTTKTVQQANLDVFTALAHPVRRQILDQLRQGQQPVNQLANEFDISRPAISQHLRVLLEAGLVSEQRFGREHFYRLEAARLRPVQDWLSHYEQFWTTKLDNLGRYLDKTAQVEREDNS